MAGHSKHQGTAGRALARISRFRKILVATDFTHGAEWAVERAAKLPVVEGSKLIVVHVLPDGIPSKYRGQINRKLNGPWRRSQVAFRTATERRAGQMFLLSLFSRPARRTLKSSV